MSLHIGIDYTAAIVQGGGIGRFTRELVRALIDADGQYRFHLFSAKQPQLFTVSDPIPNAQNVSYHESPLSERWLYRIWYRLRLPMPVQWVTGSLDLFHSPDFVLPPLSGNIPSLLTVHDLSFVHFPETFPSRLVAYLNSVVPWSINRATHILADSVSTKNDLIDIWRIAADKITVLYGGVDDKFQRVADQEQISAVRARYEIGEEPYIFTVGTLQPRKNFQMLIRAFAPVALNWPHNLIIAGGKGWMYEEMMAEVERQKMAGRVKFIGFVDDADLPTLYSDATLFVFPSLYEGFGLPLLEAMACGVPVVTSNSSSLPEVVTGEEKSAIQLPPKEDSVWTKTIHELLNDPERRTSMVRSGLKQASRFSWSKAASQLLNLYQQLTNQDI